MNYHFVCIIERIIHHEYLDDDRDYASQCRLVFVVTVEMESRRNMCRYLILALDLFNQIGHFPNRFFKINYSNS